MKKLVSVLLIFVIALSICGCKSIYDDLLSDITDRIGDSVTGDIGIFIYEHIKKKDIKTITPDKITADGITTLCYETLTKKQKQIYGYVSAAAGLMAEGWFYAGTADKGYENDVSAAYQAFCCDTPSAFWMPQSYIYTERYGKICLAFKIEGKDYENDYNLTKSERDAAIPELDAAVEKITAAAAAVSGDFEKELFVHDLLCAETEYNLNRGKMIYTAYGALVDKACVCEGYSRAMQLIMQKLGIKCGLIYGEYDGEDHMWNYIYINGGWYHLDVTWNDNETYGALHTYFNLTDSEIRKNHTVSDRFTAEKASEEKNYNMLYFDCGSEAENYYKKTNRFLTDDIASDAATIVDCFSAGNAFAELKVTAKGDIDGILQQVNNHIYYTCPLTSYTLTGTTLLVFG